MLDPGHFLILSAQGHSTSTAYWQPKFQNAASISGEEWTEQMQSMLIETVGRHMQSDVPVGAFLSGGIDSSAVLAAMVRKQTSRSRPFTIGYPGAAMTRPRRLQRSHSISVVSMSFMALEPEKANGRFAAGAALL